LGCEVR